MRDSRYTYQTAHARQCFTQIADTTISKWLSKGLVDAEIRRVTARKTIRYSAIQIVHLGVLSQLSAWGVLSLADEAIVSCPIQGDFPLKEAHKMIESYWRLGPDVCLVTSMSEVPVTQPDKRLRQTKSVPILKILTQWDFDKWRYGWQDKVQESHLLKTKMDSADFPFSFGYLVIDVSALIYHVYNELEINYLLEG